MGKAIAQKSGHGTEEQIFADIVKTHFMSNPLANQKYT